MIQKCVREDEDRIISYIGDYYPRCLYLYLDLKKYGIASDTIDIFIQRENDVTTAVMLKYYSCLHAFSRRNDFNANELGRLIEQIDLSMIYCESETAERIYAALPEEIKRRASITTGWVAQIKSVDKQPIGLSEPAKADDFEQIARLIFTDEDIGRAYKYDELACQLEERNCDGYARNFVIKQEDLVIAHACTNAEMNNIAVVAELFVRKDYRRQGYASEIWRDLCKRLLEEGKEVFSFYYSEESRALHREIGFFEV